MKAHLFYCFISLFFAFACQDRPSKETHSSKNSLPAVKDLPQKETVTTAGPVSTAADIMNRPQVPVLCYHRIENGRPDEYTVSPASFEAQMKILSDSGYHSVSPTALYDYLAYGKTLPPKPIIISFDDSRKEHASIAAPLLTKYGFKGLFFIMTITLNRKNYMTRDEIARLANEGHTIGVHTWDHHAVPSYNDSDWVKQAVMPIKLLQEITQKPVEFFAYPFGISDHKATQELKKHFKLSFILSTRRDSLEPLQSVRRMIVPYNWSAQGMLQSMRATFSRKI